MCDACYPKPAPEPAAVTPSRGRTATLPKRTAGARATPVRPVSLAGAGPVDDVGQQRVYHLTHVRNLPAILESGGLLADANESWTIRPAVDISSPDTREARRATPVAGSGDATVANFVPFFLSPDASIWQGIRSNDVDPRLSRGTAELDAADFVLLVSTVKKVIEASASDSVRGMPFVVSDGDAGHVLTRYATTLVDAERALRRLRADQESEAPAIEQAELLVEEAFPFEAVTLIGVAHDKARAAVKKILADWGFSPKVSVYPPWFAKPEQ